MILFKLDEKRHRKLIAGPRVVNRLVVRGTHHQKVGVIVSIMFGLVRVVAWPVWTLSFDVTDLANRKTGLACYEFYVTGVLSFIEGVNSFV